ncbi:hypothetical protein KCP69_00730 [Salmonella enterica subsp. enterica]|nr:hypothetical protein KCP69_00730 [Salmonella enterica subsp. enterica]
MATRSVLSASTTPPRPFKPGRGSHKNLPKDFVLQEVARRAHQQVMFTRYVRARECGQRACSAKYFWQVTFWRASRDE